MSDLVMSQPDGYRFSYTVEVRFGDTDMMGHVNHARFFTYMEQARLRYFDDVIGIDRKQGDASVILAEATCSYKLPLFDGDVVDVWTRVVHLGQKSFEQEYHLVRQSDSALVATGRTVTVAYNYQAGHTIPLPEAWRERVIAYEPALNARPG